MTIHGKIVDDHLDEFNPNYDLFNHTVLDVVPDLIYKYITGTYLIPSGRSMCR
jgi:hypothetical protein